MIVVVASYAPTSRGGSSNLGAARKIEAVIEILAKRGEKIVLVNTAHNSCVRDGLTVSPSVINSVPVTEVTPPTFASRKVGKLLNLFSVDSVLRTVLDLGKPSLVWLYNGYAFECRFGRAIARRLGCPVVLEFEDWHFARGRGLNPKPIIDWLFWRRLLPYISLATAVNGPLADRLGRIDGEVFLFPGIVSQSIAQLVDGSPPFDQEGVRVGYFGGLSAEKGADAVAALVPRLSVGTKLVVTGSGPLASDFVRLSGEQPDRLEFHGRVEDDALVRLIGSCDVLINPHKPIEMMGNGIFPFKVIEGIASGRLMISTPLPCDGLEDVLQGVHFVTDEEGLYCAISRAEAIYRKSRAQVLEGARHAFRRFSDQAIQETISANCNSQVG